MTKCLTTPALAVLLSIAFAAAAYGVQPHSRAQPVEGMPQGPFVRLDDGAIVAIDAAVSHVSRDEGKSWRSRPLFTPEQQAKLKLKVRKERALIKTKDGTLIAAFMNDAERKWTWSDELRDAPGAKLPTYVMRSTDGGATWTDIQKLHNDYTGAIRDMIQTKDGRIIFTTMKLVHDPGRHAVLTYCSDDDGVTWKASNLIDLGGAGHHGGATEPTLVELRDGRTWMLIRTNWGEFWSAYSHDGGRFWRTMQPSGIPASSAPGLVKRLASGRLVLLWNRPAPAAGGNVKLTGGDGQWSEVAVSNYRAELSMAFSEDDGATWSAPAVIATVEEGEKWVSYPYLFEAEPGVMWITTMQGNLRVIAREADFIASAAATRN